MTFRVQNSSLTLFFTTMLLILATLFALIFFLFLPFFHNAILFISLVAIFGLLIYFIPPLASTALTEWTVTQKGIQLKWQKQFLFQNKADLSIDWADIHEYKYQPDKSFDQLKIIYFEGEVLRLWHSTKITSDDFYDFIEAFEQKIRAYNKATRKSNHHIQRTKTIYETTFGLVMAVFAALTLITLPIFIFFLPNALNFRLCAGYAGTVYFLFQVISHRRKSKHLTF